MSRLKERLVASLSRDLVPPSWSKHIIAYSGAVVGGVAFARTASWSAAIRWDLFTVLCVWLSVKAGEALNAALIRAVRSLLP